MPYDPHDADTWPDATIVVRGGVRDGDGLQEVFEAEAAFSVQSDPSADFGELCRCLPNNQVRQSTLSRLRNVGGSLRESHGPDDYHCDVEGVDGRTFDSILGSTQTNPVPRPQRTGRSKK